MKSLKPVTELYQIFRCVSLEIHMRNNPLKSVMTGSGRDGLSWISFIWYKKNHFCSITFASKINSFRDFGLFEISYDCGKICSRLRARSAWFAKTSNSNHDLSVRTASLARCQGMRCVHGEAVYSEDGFACKSRQELLAGLEEARSRTMRSAFGTFFISDFLHDSLLEIFSGSSSNIFLHANKIGFEAEQV